MASSFKPPFKTSEITKQGSDAVKWDIQKSIEGLEMAREIAIENNGTPEEIERIDKRIAQLKGTSPEYATDNTDIQQSVENKPVENKPINHLLSPEEQNKVLKEVAELKKQNKALFEQYNTLHEQNNTLYEQNKKLSSEVSEIKNILKQLLHSTPEEKEQERQKVEEEFKKNEIDQFNLVKHDLNSPLYDAEKEINKATRELNKSDEVPLFIKTDPPETSKDENTYNVIAGERPEERILTADDVIRSVPDDNDEIYLASAFQTVLDDVVNTDGDIKPKVKDESYYHVSDINSKIEDAEAEKVESEKK